MKTTNAPNIGKYMTNVNPDLTDFRDWVYEPNLVRLRLTIEPPSKLTILDQGTEGACTGFGLAAVINLLYQEEGSGVRVSPRMLYEMAKRHDEWEGENYSGSSCRGAIKGWANSGVCQANSWPYKPNKPGHLTLERAKKARKQTIGAYFRLQRRISDFHAALNEVSAIFVSAHVHDGWSLDGNNAGVIPYVEKRNGAHAFAIVGYNDIGFWVQNSWGTSWGSNGLALWTYEDWALNLMDAWVFRIALSTPQIWDLKPPADEGLVEKGRPPSRDEIAGHFVHLDDGTFHTIGKYWSDEAYVKETAKLLKTTTKYNQLLLYAHGGLNSTKASAKRIRAMKEVFKENGIYPYHFMYDTGICEELKDLIFRKKEHERVQGITEWTDKILEKLTRKPGQLIWREMKQGAYSPFSNKKNDGSFVLHHLVSAIQERPIDLHLAGHSTGAILMAHAIVRLSKLFPNLRIKSVHLMAPAGTMELFHECYRPFIRTSGSFGIDDLNIYNLHDDQERDDSVGPYRKSLLYFVSRAFEEHLPAKIFGMEKYSETIPSMAGLRIEYSNGASGDKTRSTTHGGFDNDPTTMNTILKSVIGHTPTREFTKKDLSY